MTHKIPAVLADTNGHRLEAHELMTASAGLTAQDLKDVRAFLERRAQLLNKRLAGAYHFGNGVMTLWVQA